ncbi:MAG: restriction endonuclease [Candidatus Hydrogenedentes bacterium]|nr:restriction endonuclease [Candidatus Hydrogenedentota bacterium]
MTENGWKNKLYYGDNLFVMREYIADELVDLIYLDPPFNSDASYNVLFKEHDGAAAAAQIKAFEDTWRWDENAVRTYEEAVERDGRLADVLVAFRKMLGDSNMMAYIAMMAPPLLEMRRVLKPAGSIYLHCDPTASHYLKMLLDAVFGPRLFVNEIIWKRISAKGLAFTRFARDHDVILRYAKGEGWKWNPQYISHDAEYIRKFYKYVDSETGRRYRLADLTNPNKNRPHLTYEFLGVKRVWRWTKERMLEARKKGLIFQKEPGAVPALKRYLDEQEGTPVDDIWLDIVPIQASSAERLGYPTQKPVALLERIVRASSNEGDLVFDPFCGCGTTIDAAQKLGRRWIGIDITHLAISLIRHRLRDTYGEEIECGYQVIGEPTSVPDARVLAEQDPFQFQWWVLSLVGARPAEQKKGADKGIDGRLYFHIGGKHETQQVIISVKSGKPNNAHVRELFAVVTREGAALGALISMHAPTKPMRAEAAEAGTFESPWGKHAKIQILTISDLLHGKKIDMPRTAGTNVTFKKARRRQGDGGEQLVLREEAAEYGTVE